jgi:thiol-disulfide isomerase/thioredoxin
MKKFLFILFFFLNTAIYAADVEMNFTKDAFESAQKTGKTVVVNAWDKWCYICVKQEKIIKEAKKDFNDILFLSYAQKNKDIAKYLNIDYRATIVIYKNNKEIARAVGITKKEEIYSLIQKGI